MAQHQNKNTKKNFSSAFDTTVIRVRQSLSRDAFSSFFYKKFDNLELAKVPSRDGTNDIQK